MQPLTFVELEYDFSAKSDLITIRNMVISRQFGHIPYDYSKQCIILFLQELLVKSLPERSPNQALFVFVSDALILLDDCIRPANFPLWATIEIVRHLGFFPAAEELIEFINQTGGNRSADATGIAAVHAVVEILDLEWPECESLVISAQKRMSALHLLLSFLSYHSGFNFQFKSVEILHEVLNG
jgi:hypothetical protein